MGLQGLQVDHQLVEGGVVSGFQVLNPALKLVVEAGAVGFLGEVAGE